MNRYLFEGDHMDRRVEIQKETRVFDDFLAIDEAELRYRRYDGRMSDTIKRLRLDRGDSVAAVLVHEERGDILLVEQFKYPTYGPHSDGWLLELVAGTVDDGESFEDALRREVEEETGYLVRALEPIATFYVSPGGSSERVALFYAEVGLERSSSGGGVPSEGEDIAVRSFSAEDLWAALDRDEVRDAKTIVGLMWLRRRWEALN
jgi:ADP-ribose pyrophosphatase